MQSAAQDRIDLLSAVMHELGHALGREHEDGGVMADVLRPGVRTVVDEVSPTLAPASEPNAYALQRLAAAIPAAASAAQTLGPVIDWSARATGLQLPALPKVERAAPAWATDFVGDLGRSESERNPNEKLRLKVPIVSNVAAKLSALKKDASR